MSNPRIDITTLRSHPRSEYNDRAILDLLELLQLELVPGLVTANQLRELWKTSQPSVSRRLVALAAVTGWRVQTPAGRGAEVWIGPPLPPQPPSARERWESLRQRFAERNGL